jgi:uncharacterized membrane protein
MVRLLPLLGLAACVAEDSASRPAPEVVEASPQQAPSGKRDFALPLRLVGFNPSWIGRIAQDGLSIGGNTPGRVHAPYVEPMVTGGVARWRVQTREGPMEITLTPGECTDGSNQRYAFQASVVLGGRVLNGCAASELDFTWVE